MGCGSGIQALNLLFNGAGKVLAADVNEKALHATKMNCEAAGFGKKIRAKKSNLFKSISGEFDLIVFNPPYIPTPKNETTFNDLDGGKKGREVLDRFLLQMPRHLKKGGACYFLQTDLNGTGETERKLGELKMGFEIAARKKLFFEELLVYRAWKE